MASDRPPRGSEPDADLGDEDRVRDDDFQRDFGETEPADPLGQAMPDVTEAHLAEAGRPPRRNRTRPAGAGEGQAQQSQHPEREHARAPRKGLFGRAPDFLRASYQELRRV